MAKPTPTRAGLLLCAVLLSVTAACNEDGSITVPNPDGPGTITFRLSAPQNHFLAPGLSVVAEAYGVDGSGCPVAGAGSSIQAVPTSSGASVQVGSVFDVNMAGCPAAAGAGRQATVTALQSGTHAVRWTGGTSPIDQSIHVGATQPTLQDLDMLDLTAVIELLAAASNCAGTTDQTADPIEDIITEYVAAVQQLKLTMPGGGSAMILSQRMNFISGESESPVMVQANVYGFERWTGSLAWGPQDENGNVTATADFTWKTDYSDHLGVGICYIGGLGSLTGLYSL